MPIPDLPYHQLFQYTPHAQLLLTADYRILDLNRAAEALITEIVAADPGLARTHPDIGADANGILTLPWLAQALAQFATCTTATATCITTLEMTTGLRHLQLAFHRLPGTPYAAAIVLLTISDVTALHRAEIHYGAALTLLGDSLSTIFARLLAATTRITGCEHVMLQLVDRSTQTLTVLATRGATSLPLNATLPLDGTFSGLVVTSGAPIYSSDIANDPRSITRDHHLSRNLHTYLGIPVCNRDTVIAVLSLSTYTPRVYHPDELSHLTALAAIAGSLIANVQLRTAAEAANHAKSLFLAHMSHEIRTPLNGITASLSLLRHDETLSPEMQRHVASACVSADALLGLLNDVLDFSRIDAGKLELEYIDCDLRALLEDVTDILLPRLSHTPVELICHVDPAVPPLIHTDPTRLRQILLNLLSNAVKFTTRGEITVQIAPDASPTVPTLRFTVADTGIGIPPAHLSHLFQAFSQGDTSITRRFGGTGLGLAISKHLATRLGGTIGVSSAEGQGATFWFTIVFQPPSAPPTHALTPPEALARYRVLIVDPSPMAQRALADQLRAYGLSVATAADGSEALRLVTTPEAAAAVHLVVLSHRLRDMTGLDLARTLHATPTLASLPILLLSPTGQIPPEATHEVAAVLPKPPRRADLLAQIYHLLPRDTASPLVSTLFRRSPKRTITVRPGLRVLLAEDNATNREVVLRLLERLSCHADGVADGIQAVHASTTTRYDLIFMDVQMPVLDGLLATTAIREHEATTHTHVPIVAMTAQTLATDQAACLAHGMDHYVAKPITIESLATVLNRFYPLDTPTTPSEAAHPIT